MMSKITFIKSEDMLTYAIRDKEYIASIWKRFGLNLYDVTFYNNKKIKTCLVKSLKTAKEIILMYEGQYEVYDKRTNR